MRINRPFFYYKLNCFLPGITLISVNLKVDFYLGFFSSAKDQEVLTDVVGS
jgi:hypothetical protein